MADIVTAINSVVSEWFSWNWTDIAVIILIFVSSIILVLKIRSNK